MSITTIILLLLVFGLSGYSKYKKTLTGQIVGGDSDSSGDEDEDVSYSEEEEDVRVDAAPSYFTYETVTPSTVQETSAPEPQREVPCSDIAFVGETVAKPFDLRQAVVSKVILDTPYINGIN